MKGDITDNATESEGNDSKRKKDRKGLTPEDIYRVWNINEQDGESGLG
jgi:hypothetical protein